MGKISSNEPSPTANSSIADFAVPAGSGTYRLTYDEATSAMDEVMEANIYETLAGKLPRLTGAQTGLAPNVVANRAPLTAVIAC